MTFSLLFNISYQTCNTYINAMTFDACTSYPVASLSEKQLLGLADYYVDACFNPLIMTDESIFRTQAWHYNLPDLDGELTYEGVGYSEMQGAITLSRAAMTNANRLTFPGAALSFNQGGIPENIPELTYEDVKNFHEKYYHPSNCFAVLYGQFEDYTAFLALLDEAFAPYEKAEFTFEDAGYAPITEAVTAEIGFPMAEGTDVTNQAVIYYYILCPGMRDDTAQEFLIDHVCMMLNEKASVLQQRFKKAFPAGSVSAGREVAAPDDAVVFVASGMNRGDAEQFKALVDDAIRNLAENGFPQDMVDSAMTSLNISTKLAPESSSPVEGVISNIVYNYAVTGNPFYYAENVDSLSAIDRENRDGLLKEAAAKWLADKELYTLTTTYPAPGEKEKQDEALKAKLAEIKAGMTPEALQAIVDETNAPAKDDDNTELMAKIKAVTPDTVKAAAELYRKAWENGVHSTAGRAAAINANADLYDVILNPFNAKDASQVEFTDAAEGSEYYEAVRFVFENGLMAPQTDDTFGTDDPATAGDFYGAIFVMIGGTPGATDEAMATFAEYGLVPDGVEAATELTAGSGAAIFGAVTAALGAPWTPEVEAGTEEQPLTRGQMAQLISAFTDTLQ